MYFCSACYAVRRNFLKMNVRFQNILTRSGLRNKENLPFVTLALSTSSRSSSSLRSEEVFSEKSRKRCMSKIGKMKSMRPSDVPVTKRAAVLGEEFAHNNN